MDALVRTECSGFVCSNPHNRRRWGPGEWNSADSQMSHKSVQGVVNFYSRAHLFDLFLGLCHLTPFNEAFVHREVLNGSTLFIFIHYLERAHAVRGTLWSTFEPGTRCLGTFDVPSWICMWHTGRR